MRVNLKELAQQKEQIKYCQKILADQQVTKALSRKLGKIVILLDEIETDLGLSGECILELDQPRLKAIEERDKMLNFLHNGDDF